jgi:hypothetical protein
VVEVGSPVWHVITGEECTGVVTEIKDAGYGYGRADAIKLGWYARVHWLGDCDLEYCQKTASEDAEDNWYQMKYLRKVGEPE